MDGSVQCWVYTIALPDCTWVSWFVHSSQRDVETWDSVYAYGVDPQSPDMLPVSDSQKGMEQVLANQDCAAVAVDAIFLCRVTPAVGLRNLLAR